jgi:uncharacterized phiE125 gp8 family phage protein
MAVILSTAPLAPPPAEPLTLAEAKAWLRVDGAEEDALILHCLASARRQVEALSGQRLITQRWRVVLDAANLPAGPLPLPFSPLQAVEALSLTQADGSTATPDAASWRHDDAGLWLAPGLTAHSLVLTLRLGYGDAAAAVPEPLLHAVRLLLARAFEQRGDGEGEAALPAAVPGLLAPFRRLRL